MLTLLEEFEHYLMRLYYGLYASVILISFYIGDDNFIPRPHFLLVFLSNTLFQVAYHIWK